MALANRASATAVAWLHGAEAYAKTLPPRTLVIAAGSTGLVFLVLIVVGLAAAFSGRSGPTSQAAIQGSGLAASTGTAVASITPEPGKLGQTNIPSADESAEVPVIAVDSLPVAGRGAPAKGNGRLQVIASPGWCSVSIDGVQRGVTPLAGLDLPAGMHRLDCVSPAGRTRTASVSIAEGTATHYRFTLDE
jgi:serine/threonine-protein kinase